MNNLGWAIAIWTIENNPPTPPWSALVISIWSDDYSDLIGIHNEIGRCKFSDAVPWGITHVAGIISGISGFAARDTDDDIMLRNVLLCCRFDSEGISSVRSSSELSLNISGGVAVSRGEEWNTFKGRRYLCMKNDEFAFSQEKTERIILKHLDYFFSFLSFKNTLRSKFYF